jgi:hypothetical protein
MKLQFLWRRQLEASFHPALLGLRLGRINEGLPETDMETIFEKLKLILSLFVAILSFFQGSSDINIKIEIGVYLKGCIHTDSVGKA